MILKTVERTVTEKIPVAFMCDICERVIEISGDFDLKYRNKVSDHMAVVKYGTPTHGGPDASTELHCCSTHCLISVIKRIPYDATITIPMGEKFIK